MKNPKGSDALNLKNKLEKEKRKEFEKRQKKALEEFQATSKKYKVGIVGALEYQRSGVYPVVAIVDEKGKYENKEPVKPSLEL